MFLPSLTYFILFVLPLVVLPQLYLMFEPPKAVIGQILIQIMLIYSLIKFSPKFFKTINPLLLFLSLILISLSLLQLFIYQDQSLLYGNPFRLQGMVLLWHLLFFAYFSSRIDLDHFPRPTFFVPLLGLFLGTLIMGTNSSERSIGTLGEPNALATTVLFFLPFSAVNSDHPHLKNKWLVKLTKILSVIMGLGILILSGSRSGVLGLFIMILFLLGLKLKLSFKTAVVISLTFIIVSFVIPFREGGGWYENRSEIWQTAFYSGLSSPILGHGFGNVQQALIETSIALNNNIRHQIIDSSHNLFLDIWVQGGFIGLVGLLGLLGGSIRGLIKHKRVLELTSLLGLLVALSFNPVSAVNLFAFYFLIGQGYRN